MAKVNDKHREAAKKAMQFGPGLPRDLQIEANVAQAIADAEARGLERAAKFLHAKADELERSEGAIDQAMAVAVQRWSDHIKRGGSDDR